MLVPPHFLVSTAFKKMRWKDEFRKWLPKLPICRCWLFLTFIRACNNVEIESVPRIWLLADSVDRSCFGY